MSKDKCLLTIQQLFQDYKDNEQLLKKIENFVNISLPNKLFEIEKNNKIRQDRIDYLNEESNKFIMNFLSQKDNMFFYISISELFIQYDGVNYKIINEDDVWYLILREISKNKNLLNWKYKIKNSIIKKIKENNILHSIPESATIQKVLDYFCAKCIITKDHAKYILTILGDNLFKRDISQKLVYFTEPTYKKWFQTISELSFFYFRYSKNPIDNIKFKFYNHNFENCRLLNLTMFSNNKDDFLRENILNVLCVASHYSKRFSNADNFILHHCNTFDLIQNVMFLKNNELSNILKTFKKQYLEKTEHQRLFITEKDLLFLWKDFLSERNLPQIIFSQDLKQQIQQHLDISYNDIFNYYPGYTSERLKLVQNFIQFCDTSIEKDTDEHDFELGELVSLYNIYLKQNNKSHIYYLNEDNCKNILNLFYDIEIVDDKYLLHIKCNLWDKDENIKKFLNNFYSKSDMSLYDLYNEYCVYNSKNKHNLSVSKLFFNKFINREIDNNYIQDNSILLKDYWEDKI